MSAGAAALEAAEHDRAVHGRARRRRRADAQDVLDAFLAARRAHVTEGTIRYYTAALQPFWAHMAPRRIELWRPADVERWIAAHPAWSARSKDKLLRTLATFVRWARRDYAVADLTEGIRAPRLTRRPVDPLAAADVRRLLEAAAAHPWLEVPVALAAFAGLSLGDIRSLDWSEVDLSAGRIVRARQKSGRPLDVRIGAGLRAVLERHRAIGGPVARGLPTSDSAVAKAVRELYARARVGRASGRGLHWLRTAFVSIGVRGSGDLTAVADVVGDDPATISRHYAHSGRAARDAVVDAVDREIRG